MKTIFATIFFLAISYTHTAQNTFEVIEQPLPYNVMATSFTTDIIGLNEGFILYQWEKFIENHKGETYVTSSEKGNIELRSEHVEFPLLNNEEVSIHTRVTPNSTESGVLLTIWIQTKDGSYFSSKNHPEQAKNIKDWLFKFNRQLEELNEKTIINGFVKF